MRFRCHTGHAYSADSLLAAINEAIEDALWNTVRAIDEGARFIRHLADHLQPHDRHAPSALPSMRRRRGLTRKPCGSSCPDREALKGVNR